MQGAYWYMGAYTNIQRVSFGSGIDFKGRKRAPGAGRAQSGRGGVE
jgi:hypothetical protein